MYRQSHFARRDKLLNLEQKHALNPRTPPSVVVEAALIARTPANSITPSLFLALHVSGSHRSAISVNRLAKCLAIVNFPSPFRSSPQLVRGVSAVPTHSLTNNTTPGAVYQSPGMPNDHILSSSGHGQLTITVQPTVPIRIHLDDDEDTGSLFTCGLTYLKRRRSFSLWRILNFHVTGVLQNRTK